MKFARSRNSKSFNVIFIYIQNFKLMMFYYLISCSNTSKHWRVRLFRAVWVSQLYASQRKLHFFILSL